MKLIDGDKLERHLNYLIKRDNQFAEMCDGNDDYSRQRKYCFEVDALAYQLCKSVMDYYIIQPEDVIPAKRGHWIKETLGYSRCSNCGEIRKPSNFCPECGYDMRETKEGLKNENTNIY